MGIQTIPEIKPVSLTYQSKNFREVEVENPVIQFGKRLEAGAISLDSEDVRITIAKDDTIEINGLKACAYIKKQSYGVNLYRKTSTYRYHLCNCATIQSMIADGRLSRYVSTTRSDGLFPVIVQSPPRAKEHILELELCKNCREMLAARGMLPNHYSLEKFFNAYQPDIPKTIRRTEQVITKEKYAPDHPEVARRYKERENYRCQMCSVNCQDAQHCLHLHHIDGDGQNNNRSNLRVFCADCHARQSRHTHMLGNPNFIQMINQIKKLRKEQGILSLD